VAVEVRAETIELFTYVWGPPDPYPPFQRTGKWATYPYPLLDDIREQGRPVGHRALVLENEHLRVIVLPDLGGRIYSALDKHSGEEVFYRNNVVKPGLIALRGAWISGGVEFNFPCGHTVSTVSPVDRRVLRDEDGSAAVWVGAVERIHRMSWAVGIRLRPDSAVLETDIRLQNRTALPHPYYFWSNAAVPARNDMRLIYPGTRVFAGRERAISWPVYEGRDLSRYTAFPGANDVFLADSLEDFFGVYYEERDFGLVHVADVHQAFGKKFFTWGTADHGRMWSAALSDRDGPYCEVQSGRFVDQATWRLLAPHHTVLWTEHWYPVRGIGGFSYANRDAAVRIATANGQAECGVHVTRTMPDATISLTAGGRVVHEERRDLSPAQPVRMRVPLGGAGGPVSLRVVDSTGAPVIAWTEGQPPRTIRLAEEPARGEATPGEKLRRALDAEEKSEPARAWQLYSEVLHADPACVQAAVALGRLAIECRPQEAPARLGAAAAAAPESADAAYYRGVALARAGEDDAAEVELWRAAREPAFAHAARLELARIRLRRRDWEGAQSALAEAIRFDAADAGARALLAAALRRAGRVREAARQVEVARAQSPLDRLAAAEAHFCAAALRRPRVAARRLRELCEMMSEEADPWVELALDYAGTGMREEAVKLLEWAAGRMGDVKASPIVHYLLAWCLEQLGRQDEAAAARRRARELPLDLAFPHQWELERALREAIERDPEDAHARYLLGCLLYHHRRREEALRQWEAAAPGLPGFPVALRNLALARRQVRGDLAGAEAALARAVETRPAHPRPYLELNEVMRERGAAAQARLAMLDSAPAEVQRRGAIAAEQALCCIAQEDWDRAISLLTTHTFHRWEMEFRMRAIYVQAYLGRGTQRFDAGDVEGARGDFERALEYPDNLRIGRPPKTADARAHWCAGVACEALGDGAAAMAHWEAAAAEDHHEEGSELHTYRALSLRKLGRQDEAEQVLAGALRAARHRADLAPGDAAAQLSLARALRASGQEEEATAALRRALEIDPRCREARRLLEAHVIL